MTKDLLIHIVKSIVLDADSVRVSDRLDGPTYVVNIWVNQDDLKRIIGKEGRVIKAIRALVGALSTTERIDVVLDSHEL